MSETFPNHPNVYASADETEIDCDDLYNDWRGKFEERVNRMVKKLGWEYQIGATSLSRTADFDIIFRAKVKYILDDGVYETVEVLWRDIQGLNGSGSAPIETLSYDTPQEFSFSGSARHLFEPPVSWEVWVEIDVANDF